MTYIAYNVMHVICAGPRLYCYAKQIITFGSSKTVIVFSITFLKYS